MNKANEAALDLNLDAIERYIRHARADMARTELEKLLKNPVPRSRLARVGQLLWRSGSPLDAIKLLHRIIHPKGKNVLGGSPVEKAEYAGALTFIGANEEALRVLKSLDAKENPKVLLYQSFSYFSQWEYAQAIPLLKQYCAWPGLGLYEKVVADLNLAAALVHEAKEYAPTKTTLDRLLKVTAQEHFRFLEGIAFETSAQNEFFHGNDKAAMEYLDRAQELLFEGQSNDGLFVQKWRAIIKLKAAKTREAGLSELKKVRLQAQENAHWETLRDCDRFEALYTQNSELLLSVYFGTPYPAFKDEILKQRLFPFNAPPQGIWKLKSGKKATQIDATSVENLSKDAAGKTSELMAKLFRTLTSDFYRPWGVPSLFAKLYPEEYFNPLSSPARVHRAIQRLRLWFKDLGLPLNLIEEHGFYRLEAQSPVHILLSSSTLSPEDSTLAKLASHFRNQTFSVSEAASVLQVSKRTALRTLNQATEEGKLNREGGGRATVYKLAAI